MDNRNAGWKPGDTIGYIRPQIPEFSIPPYAGERYHVLAPDTLDLQERAELAINALTQATDPLADYEQYFDVDINRNPPVMRHSYCDQCQNKFMEALPLLRIITGSHLAEQVDRRWMETALHRMGPDGICYTPVRGRPWALTAGPDFGLRSTGKDQFIEPFFGGRLLSAMMIYGIRDGGHLWQNEARRMVDGLTSLAVDRGRYAFFAPSTHYAEKGSNDEYGRRFPAIGAHVAFVALGLVHVFRTIGYEPALILAGKLLAYAFDELQYVRADGSYGLNGTEPGQSWSTGAHFHMHTYLLLAALEYAMQSHDDNMLQLVQRGFEFGKVNGNALIGFFPDMLYTPLQRFSEICEVADMMALGLKLTTAGVADHWDDVDRWARNMFAEGQLTRARAEWLARYSAQFPKTAPDPTCETADRVLERNVGAFDGWPTPNDWHADVAESGIMHCCTGNGARAIYYLWEHIVTQHAGKVHINLLLNRASSWADIDSHIPYEGQVDIVVKQPLELNVRIPEWVQPHQVEVRVDGQARSPGWEGRYAIVGSVKPRQVVMITFPIFERTDVVWLEKSKYTLVRKGNDVVAIDPPGKNCPLFQREHYRADTTRWRQVERFVSQEQLYW